MKTRQITNYWVGKWNLTKLKRNYRITIQNKVYRRGGRKKMIEFLKNGLYNIYGVENQLKKRMNRPVRALYNEESLLKENQMTVPYKKYGYEQVFSGVDE